MLMPWDLHWFWLLILLACGAGGLSLTLIASDWLWQHWPSPSWFWPLTLVAFLAARSLLR